MSGSSRGAGPGDGLPAAPAPARTPLDPAWQPWLSLLDLALEAAADPAWAAMVPEPHGGRPPLAPLLHGTTIRLDARRASRLVRQIARALHAVEHADGGGMPARASALPDPAALIRAAIEHDPDALERMSVVAGVPSDRIAVLAQLVALPLLHACASVLAPRIRPGWLAGHCPVCGAWPALAEMRGIERRRQMRCGTCASAWELPVLLCPFCGERSHERLSSFFVEGEEQRRRVESCASCGGYLKTVTVLRALAPRDLAIEDLASIELDLVARDRGLARPEHLAYPLSITVERATSRTGLPAALARWMGGAGATDERGEPLSS